MIRSRNLNDLHPYVKHLAEKLIEESKKQGIEIKVICTYRDKEYQDHLYTQGRTRKGKIVTNARGGQSVHNYKLALDFCVIRNCNIDWNCIDLYKRVGQIWKSLSGHNEYGGDWKMRDYGHCQWTGGFTLKQLQQGYYPADPRGIKDEFTISIEKLVNNKVINSPEYWINNSEYKSEYVRELIKKFANKL